ncbi:protein quiver-like [Dreissena polymorpha]|uniref:protein quiver-like n=1 Tax=Dreissena polymorpha TaxID=45954 RepID=UPI0022641859|nr:protein quiver-like [Dreissena polymorpha]
MRHKEILLFKPGSLTVGCDLPDLYRRRDMVGTNTFVLASVLAVLISVSKVDAAFKCYSCDSVTDSGCSDKFSASSAFESPATCRGCSMVKLYGVVTRACLIQSLGNTCEESGENAACYCESELCNGSNTLAISTATLIYASLAVFLYKF